MTRWDFGKGGRKISPFKYIETKVIGANASKAIKILAIWAGKMWI